VNAPCPSSTTSPPNTSRQQTQMCTSGVSAAETGSCRGQQMVPQHAPETMSSQCQPVRCYAPVTWTADQTPARRCDRMTLPVSTSTTGRREDSAGLERCNGDAIHHSPVYFACRLACVRILAQGHAKQLPGSAALRRGKQQPTNSEFSQLSSPVGGCDAPGWMQKVREAVITELAATATRVRLTKKNK